MHTVSNLLLHTFLFPRQVLKEGNAEVIDMLIEQNYLASELAYEHRYPLDWRTKQPVILRATRQYVLSSLSPPLFSSSIFIPNNYFALFFIFTVNDLFRTLIPIRLACLF